MCNGNATATQQHQRTHHAPLSYLFSDTFGDLNRQIFVLESSARPSAQQAHHFWFCIDGASRRVGEWILPSCVRIPCLFYINFLLDAITTFLHMLYSVQSLLYAASVEESEVEICLWNVRWGQKRRKCGVSRHSDWFQHTSFLSFSYS